MESKTILQHSCQNLKQHDCSAGNYVMKVGSPKREASQVCVSLSATSPHCTSILCFSAMWTFV